MRFNLYLCLWLDNAFQAESGGEHILSDRTLRHLLTALHDEGAMALGRDFPHRYDADCGVCCLAKAVRLLSRERALAGHAEFLAQTRERAAVNVWRRIGHDLRPVFRLRNVRQARRLSGYGRHAILTARKTVAEVARVKIVPAIEDMAYIWRGEDEEFPASSLESLLWPQEAAPPRPVRPAPAIAAAEEAEGGVFRELIETCERYIVRLNGLYFSDGDEDGNT